MGLKDWFFDLQYLLGRTPWDSGVTPPEVMEFVQGFPPGRALDLGCGTGTNSITLACHGWEVVGVDFSGVAIRRARRKARRAGFDCRFHRADVTDLSFLTASFDLALDIGCLHSLPPEKQEQYAAGLARLVRPGGLYMLYAFLPWPDRHDSQGVTPEEIHRLFGSAFIVERQEGGDDPTGPRSAWTWMRRAGSTSD
jgi:SAM-dependent methyltransferase